MTSRWVFLRHGQSVGNVSRCLVAPFDSPLTDRGQIQADSAAVALRELGVRRVVCSPMVRAVQTAERVCVALGGLRPIVEDALVERTFGELDAWTVEAVKCSRWTATRTAWRSAPPGGETLEAVAERAISALVRHVGAGPVLVVAHAGPIRAVVGLLDGVDMARIGRVRVPHCQPWVREVADTRWPRLIARFSRSS